MNVLLTQNFMIFQLVFAHDTARVIECLFEKASQDIREAVFNELKPHIINLAKSQYAHFYLMKVLRHGNKDQRNFVIQALSGKVVFLMKHKVLLVISILLSSLKSCFDYFLCSLPQKWLKLLTTTGLTQANALCSVRNFTDQSSSCLKTKASRLSTLL